MVRISDHRSLIPGKWPISRIRFPGTAKDNENGGPRLRCSRTIVTASSSRCDNATVKLSHARKILSQFKFHRDDPLEVSG